MSTTAAAARLEVSGMRKAFGGVQALAGASLTTTRGEGRAVLLISSELPELLALSDRIVTLYRGRVTAEIAREHATEESVGQHILGG